jgi:hypothetical protein
MIFHQHTQAYPSHVNGLQALGACSEAVEFAEGFNSLDEAWQACERGDWMLWFVGETIGCEPWTEGRKPLLACALDCAETVRYLWSPLQTKAIAAFVSVLRSWIDGKATTEEAREARNGLVAYYISAAAYHIASLAAASYYAANCSAAADASRQHCARIVREHYPHSPAPWRNHDKPRLVISQMKRRNHVSN